MFQMIISGKLYLLEDAQRKQTSTFHDSTVTRTESSSHKREKKKETATIIEGQMLSTTFMMGIIC